MDAELCNTFCLYSLLPVGDLNAGGGLGARFTVPSVRGFHRRISLFSLERSHHLYKSNARASVMIGSLKARVDAPPCLSASCASGLGSITALKLSAADRLQ